MSKLRRDLYRAGSVLGDAEAWASGDPNRIAKRYLRKSIWRSFGRIMRRILR